MVMYGLLIAVADLILVSSSCSSRLLLGAAHHLKFRAWKSRRFVKIALLLTIGLWRVRWKVWSAALPLRAEFVLAAKLLAAVLFHTDYIENRLNQHPNLPYI